MQSKLILHASASGTASIMGSVMHCGCRFLIKQISSFSISLGLSCYTAPREWHCQMSGRDCGAQEAACTSWLACILLAYHCIHITALPGIACMSIQHQNSSPQQLLGTRTLDIRTVSLQLESDYSSTSGKGQMQSRSPKNTAYAWSTNVVVCLAFLRIAGGHAATG